MDELNYEKLIIVRIWEGLGNQLFQYAYARALKEQGKNVALDLDKTYSEAFGQYKNNDVRTNAVQNYRITLPAADVRTFGKYDFILQDTFGRRLKCSLAKKGIGKYAFHEETVQHYQEASANVRANTYVKGWFQSEKYFADIRPILLEELLPKELPVFSEEVRELLRDEQCVSIHFRRGDYVRIHHELNIAYFHQAVEEIRRKYDHPKFLIFSDDVDWVLRNLRIDEKCISANPDNVLKDYEELYLMSLCKSNIISNSTFSWWGAWLNRNPDKTVIAPKLWLEGQEGILPPSFTVI